MAVYLGTSAVPHQRRLANRGLSTVFHPGQPLRIGLVNNMPDAALAATERQFITLLNAASGSLPVHLSLYALPGIPRQPRAAKYLRDFYASTDTLHRESLDGLIVTGTEPLSSRLQDEPYWPALTRLVEWAKGNTGSAVWSCLAAHAAVLHLDGVRRVRAEGKHFGVFRCAAVSDHSLLRNLSRSISVPHSRWNGLDENDLLACSYHMLTRGEEVGVDLFLKQYESLFVFSQGHPEYEADTLMREYRRDATRYLCGETAVSPQLPRSYFDGETADMLAAVSQQPAALRDDEDGKRFFSVLAAAQLTAAWHPAACALYRNWLGYLQAKQGRSLSRAAALLGTPALTGTFAAPEELA